MPSLERKISIDTWSILKVLLVLGAVGILYLVRDILALVFSAVFLAALMHPAARYLAQKGIPKGITVLVLYVLLCGLGALTFGLLLPPLIEQTAGLVESIGLSWPTLTDVSSYLRHISFDQSLVENFQAGMRALQSGELSQAASGLISILTQVFGGIVGIVVVLVMAFYAVVEEQEARNIFHNLVPEEYQEISANILKQVEEKIGRWLIGQLSLGLIIGLMYYVGLSLIGVKSALVLAVFGGFMEFIPYLGPILGAIPAIIMALTHSPFQALLALIVLVIIQQLENHVIVPKVMQKAVGLNPLISIIALLIGAKLFGIVGMLFAIPVSTSIAVVLSELFRYSKAKKE